MPSPFIRNNSSDQPLLTPIKRRSFFLYAGATAGATALLLSGCDDDKVVAPGDSVDVGSGDLGVLNYAYALEQLEAAFYARVKEGSYYANANVAEKQIFDDLAGHEVLHRDFLKAAVSSVGTPLKDLETDFTAINFNDRAIVLQYAQTFEDTGVAAYNGAARFISVTPTGNNYLTLTGKIVSVEARHAALIRDLRTYNSFVANDVVNLFTQTANAVPGTGTARDQASATVPGPGQERSKRPQAVLEAVNPFLAVGSRLTANNLK